MKSILKKLVALLTFLLFISCSFSECNYCNTYIKVCKHSQVTHYDKKNRKSKLHHHLHKSARKKAVETGLQSKSARNVTPTPEGQLCRCSHPALVALQIYSTELNIEQSKFAYRNFESKINFSLLPTLLEKVFKIPIIRGRFSSIFRIQEKFLI